eukprot:3369838-Amphidinium_carterae.1
MNTASPARILAGYCKTTAIDATKAVTGTFVKLDRSRTERKDGAIRAPGTEPATARKAKMPMHSISVCSLLSQHTTPGDKWI